VTIRRRRAVECLARKKKRLRRNMPKGKVKWFNSTKGYGFIEPEDGGDDVFVHMSAVRNAGMQDLQEDQVVEYELVQNNGKTSAENLK
jgi:CspA family cold shock protein